MKECPNFENDLLLMRTAGLAGPFFQRVRPGCVSSLGNAYAIGGPLSGPRATTGIVSDANTVRMQFTQCIKFDGVEPYGVDIKINDVSATLSLLTLENNGTILVHTVDPPIQAGDDVRWEYVEGPADRLLACRDDEPIGDQGPLPVLNPLVLEGDFMLLETGGSDILLLEDDIDLSDGIQLETAP